MPRDLFGDVTDPFITLGTRKWYTVPVSLAVHSIIVVLLIIAPLMASGALPLLPDDTVYVPVEPPELPQPPAPRSKATEQPVVRPDAAPVEEPQAIGHETPFEPGFEKDTAVEPLLGGGQVDGSAVIAPPPVVVALPVSTPTVNVGGNIRPPERLTYVNPTYPPIALGARVQGLVVIQATIDTAGRVQDARVLRSDATLLNEAALTAVGQWVFTPTLLNGIPVNVIMTVTVHFRIP